MSSILESPETRLARMEGKIDVILERQGDSLLVQETHNTRIRSLENSRARLMGMAATVGAFVTLLFDYVFRSTGGGG